jgi:hypothetical protein
MSAPYRVEAAREDVAIAADATAIPTKLTLRSAIL